MKIRNLMDYPFQIGDGQMIGAAGTPEEQRDYGLDKLTADDQKLVKSNMLEATKVDVPITESEPEKSKTGGNSNAK